MDAAGVGRAVLVSWSCGAAWSVRVAAQHPDRVAGLFVIAPSCGLSVPQPAREQFPWDKPALTTAGWAKYNKHYWLDGDYADFLRFFFAEMFPEPHSTKQIEDGVRWGHQIEPTTLVDTVAGRLGCDGAVCTPLEPFCAQVRCPVTVLHGTDDRVRTPAIAQRLVDLTGGSLVLVEGSGHAPHLRDPVLVNGEIRAFVDRVEPPVGPRKVARARSRSKRALYICSPIGLGHARRDVAIADELRRRQPELQIDWLAQSPVTRVLAERQERVHPASAALLSESQHFEDEAEEHDLHAFQAVRRMDEVLVNNFMVYADLVEREPYDLVIGDEAWDIDYFLHENPSLKRSAYAWLTDFVGWLPMPEGGADEAALTADYNSEMIEQRARFRTLRDVSVFVGDSDDVVTDTFGPDLPSIRAWTEANFDFAGYVTGFSPVDGEADRVALRARLGYRDNQRLCVVTVGGSAVGSALLRRVLAAVPIVRRAAPDLQFLVVTGPRIDPRSLPRTRGVHVRGYLPELFRYLAACDVAVVQGGLTTCMELTAARRPFVYVPLEHHFEQNFHVRHRLERYGAGRCVPYADAADPDALARAILAEVEREVAYLPVQTDGAARAADLLAQLL
jgi:predicted glycosyltransferase